MLRLAWPNISFKVLGGTPALMARLANVSRKACGANGFKTTEEFLLQRLIMLRKALYILFSLPNSPLLSGKTKSQGEKCHSVSYISPTDNL